MEEKYYPSEEFARQFYKTKRSESIQFLEKSLEDMPKQIENVPEAEREYIRKTAEFFSGKINLFLKGFKTSSKEEPTKEQIQEVRDIISKTMGGVIISISHRHAWQREKIFKIADLNRFSNEFPYFFEDLGDSGLPDSLYQLLYKDFSCRLREQQIKNQLYELSFRDDGIYAELSQKFMEDNAPRPEQPRGDSVVVGGIDVSP